MRSRTKVMEGNPKRKPELFISFKRQVKIKRDIIKNKKKRRNASRMAVDVCPSSIPSRFD